MPQDQTCSRTGAPDALYRCQLYSQISEFEPLLMMAENGIQTLFQMLRDPADKISRKGVDFVADQLQEVLIQIKDHWEALREEAAGLTAEEVRDIRFNQEAARRKAEAGS